MDTHTISTTVGECTPRIRDRRAGYSNDPSVAAPHVGGLLSHNCKAERGGTKTAGAPEYVLVVKNAPGEEALPQL